MIVLGMVNRVCGGMDVQLVECTELKHKPTRLLHPRKIAVFFFQFKWMLGVWLGRFTVIYNYDKKHINC